MNRTEDGLRAFYAELSANHDAEQRLQRWVSDTADRPMAEPTARSRRTTVVAIVAAVAAVAVGAVILASRSSAPERRPPATVSASATFVTVVRDHGQQPAYAVQLRRISNGAVIRTVVRASPQDSVSTAQTAGGQIVVALTNGCTTTLERVDPSTGGTSVLRKIDETVAGLALSPDGEHLAYLTHPTCVVRHCPSVCAGLAEFAPNVLVVLDLASGRSVRTATGDPGRPMFGLSWSPDGHRIVAGYDGNHRKLLVLDGVHPDFQDARQIPDQPGCSYFAPSWTKAGIVAAEGCGPDSFLSPSRVVQLDEAGAISATWPLPHCIDGVVTRTDPTHERTLVQSSIGYGNGSCGRFWATRIARVDRTSLHTVLDLPGAAQSIELDG